MFYVIVAVIILCVIIGIWVIAYDNSHFVIKEYTISSAKIKKKYVLVLLADLHNKSYGKENESLIQAIEKLEPDGIAIAGDMYTSKVGKSFEPALGLVSTIAEKFPVFYGNGNHENKTRIMPEKFGNMYHKYWEKLQEKGVYPIRDAHVLLKENNIDLAALELDQIYFRRIIKRPLEMGYLENKLNVANADAYQILIAHNPEYFSDYADWGADLVLSGHIHGGVVRLPLLGGVISPTFRIFPKYDGGLFCKKDKKMILSRGLGMHTLPIRMFNPGELVKITLYPKEE